MSIKYKTLLSPLKIGPFTLKNRMVSSNSLPHFLQGPETYPADPVFTHYVNRARSGAAIVTCMGINNMLRGKQIPTEVDAAHFPDFELYNPLAQNYLIQLTEGIHFYDSLAAMALFVGRKSDYCYLDNGVPTGVPAHLDVTEYDEETLEKIVQSYVQQASMLKWLGFDMISFHFAYRNQLPARFMSPLTNHRTDAYNGSVENRCRYAKRVLHAVREAVGRDMLLEVLISAEEPEGGYTLDDTVAFLRMVEDDIDIVQLRAPEADPNHPTGFCLEETPFLHYAEYVKNSGVRVVVSGVGGYQYMPTCEQAVAEGKLDLVAMARSWISNPDYGQLVYEGRDEDMVPCIRCNKCHGRGQGDPFASVCSVNPILGLEHHISNMVRDPSPSKRIAVIGGGPGGMRAALYLSDRGHSVTIFEKSDGLGGAIRHADFVSFKWPLKRYKDWLIAQVGKRPIQVRLQTLATPEQIQSEGFDVVLAAVGADPVRPPIPGADGPNVCFATDILCDHTRAGHRVVVIGGGEVGTETGMHLAEHGHEVTVLEMRDTLAADTTKIHYRSMFQAYWESLPGFHFLLSATCTSIQDGSVSYQDSNGTAHTLEADTVVLSAGMRAKRDEALAYYGACGRFYMVGDCRKPATLQQTNRSAFAVASQI